MIISADYDGLICAAFLHHHLNWIIEGYYDLTNIWVSKKGIQIQIFYLLEPRIKWRWK